MKTQLPPTIENRLEAEKFLLDLHKNNEAFHPEDDAHNIVWQTTQPTEKEKDQLNKLMDDIYLIEGFDPCEYLLKLKKL